METNDSVPARGTLTLPDFTLYDSLGESSTRLILTKGRDYSDASKHFVVGVEVDRMPMAVTTSNIYVAIQGVKQSNFAHSVITVDEAKELVVELINQILIQEKAEREYVKDNS